MQNLDSNIISIDKFRAPASRRPIAISKKENSEIGPIEAEMRVKLQNFKGTRYPDTFDWSIYDKISARFGDNQPRGSVVFKSPFKLANHNESCSKCHYSFEIDSYGRGCVHNCIYCYARETLSKYGYWNRPIPFPADLTEVRKAFYTVFETNKTSEWRKILEKKIPLRIGSMSDSFMLMDKKYGITKELLKILKFYQYPYIVFTRSDLVADDEYLSLLDKNLAAVQFSICGGNEELTRKIEPGAPSVKRRLVAIKKLTENGFWTTVCINPLFPIFPDGYFTDQDYIRERFGSLNDVPKFNLFDFDFIDLLGEYKVPSLLTGFVRLSTVALKQMSEATGVDLKSFYRPENLIKSNDKRYSDREISAYYWQIAQRCNKAKIRFNTCYIGNGIKDYFQYQHLWDNRERDCCDVRGNVSTFKSSSQEIDWSVRQKFSQSTDKAENARILEIQADAKFGSELSKTNANCEKLPDSNLDLS